MADPTAKAREALKSIVPESTPLGKSFAEQKQADEEQLAADEANNLVMQRDPVALPAEAQAFTDPAASLPGANPAGQAFVNPSAPAQAAQRAPAEAAIAGTPAPASSQAEAPVIPDQTKAINDAQSTYEKAASDTQAQIDKLNQDRLAAIDKHMADDEKNVEKVKPTELFAGKNTWQKILGGVGMFLGSLTPEGARNVASMIDKEIERDQHLQMTNIKLKRDKEDRHFQNLIQKYGSQEAALLAKKRDAYTAIDLHLKKLDAVARNAETKAKIGMGLQELDLKRQALNVELQKAAMKAQQEYNKGSIPGYQGTITDQTAARDFRNQVTSAQSAFSEIDNLLKINKKGISSAFSPADRASAQQSQTLLQGQLREALVGPGAVSEGERNLLRDAIANPTNFFSLSSSNELKLNKLKQALRNKIDANARAYGLQKIVPKGAEKV